MGTLLKPRGNWEISIICYSNNGSFYKYSVGCSYNTGNQTLHQIYQNAETLPCIFVLVHYKFG